MPVGQPKCWSKGWFVPRCPRPLVMCPRWLLSPCDGPLFLSHGLPVSLTVTHDHIDGVVEFSWKRHRLFNHTACLVLYQLCMEVRKSQKVVIWEDCPGTSQAAPLCCMSHGTAVFSMHLRTSAFGTSKTTSKQF